MREKCPSCEVDIKEDWKICPNCYFDFQVWNEFKEKAKKAKLRAELLNIQIGKFHSKFQNKEYGDVIIECINLVDVILKDIITEKFLNEYSSNYNDRFDERISFLNNKKLIHSFVSNRLHYYRKLRNILTHESPHMVQRTNNFKIEINIKDAQGAINLLNKLIDFYNQQLPLSDRKFKNFTEKKRLAQIKYKLAKDGVLLPPITNKIDDLALFLGIYEDLLPEEKADFLGFLETITEADLKKELKEIIKKLDKINNERSGSISLEEFEKLSSSPSISEIAGNPCFIFLKKYQDFKEVDEIENKFNFIFNLDDKVTREFIEWAIFEFIFQGNWDKLDVKIDELVGEFFDRENIGTFEYDDEINPDTINNIFERFPGEFPPAIEKFIFRQLGKGDKVARNRIYMWNIHFPKLFILKVDESIQKEYIEYIFENMKDIWDEYLEGDDYGIRESVNEKNLKIYETLSKSPNKKISEKASEIYNFINDFKT